MLLSIPSAYLPQADVYMLLLIDIKEQQKTTWQCDTLLDIWGRCWFYDCCLHKSVKFIFDDPNGSQYSGVAEISPWLKLLAKYVYAEYVFCVIKFKYHGINSLQTNFFEWLQNSEMKINVYYRRSQQHSHVGVGF